MYIFFVVILQFFLILKTLLLDLTMKKQAKITEENTQAKVIKQNY